MKSLKLFLLPILILIGTNIYAEDNSKNEKDPENQIIILLGSDYSNKRPRMPKRIDIDCYYSDGILYINFEEPEGNAQLRLEDMISSEYSVYAFSTFSEYSINVGDIKNPIKIEITTDENTYIGYLSE